MTVTEGVGFPINDSETDVAPDRKAGLSLVDAPKSEGICAEPGCTNLVYKGTRGPASKWCAEHKEAHAHGDKGTGTKRASASSRKWPNRAQTLETLMQYPDYLGGLVMFIHRPDGEVITAKGPRIITELVNLGDDDPNLRKWLDRLATPGKYGPIVMATLGLVLPLLANHGGIPSFAVNLLGFGDTEKQPANPTGGE